MTVLGLHHVQLAMPRGREDDARAFYVGILGFAERPKPPNLAVRGGAWFSAGSAELHLGVEEDFRPAKKAHPALLVTDVMRLASECTSAGFAVTIDEPLPGFHRVYVSDPFGNRIELLQPETKATTREVAAVARRALTRRFHSSPRR
jgi:catechol 2,3-dioxygenase-like lactoylglutathione lyase family enzyme